MVRAMARQPRGEKVVVPDLPTHIPPDPDEPEDDLEDDDQPISVHADAGDLAALADAQYSDWTWHIYRLRSIEDLARQRTRQQKVWVLKLTGPIDVSALRDAVGGGLFEVWGFINGRLKTKISFELEGPPRYYHPPAPAPQPIAAVAAAPPSPPNGTDPVLLKFLEQQQQLLAAILGKLNAQPAAPTGFSFREMLQLATMVSGGGRGGSPDMKDLVALFQSGLEVGSNAVNGSDKSTLDVILEKGLPVLERIAVGMAARNRPRPPGVAPGQPVAAQATREPSSASVIDTPPSVATTTAVPVPNPDQVTRWNAAVDALARAIENRDDPADFADTLDHLLLPAEIDLMLAGGVGDVMAQLQTAAERFPILTTDDAHAFVEAVLASLAEPPGA